MQQHLDTLIPPPVAPAPAPDAAAAAAPAADGASAMDTDAAPAPAAEAAAPEAAAAPAPAAAPLSPEEEALRVKVQKVKDILSGKVPIGLYLDFLYRWVSGACFWRVGGGWGEGGERSHTSSHLPGCSVSL